MFNLDQLLIRVVKAADNIPAEWTDKQLNTPEEREWSEAFNALREYVDNLQK